ASHARGYCWRGIRVRPMAEASARNGAPSLRRWNAIGNRPPCFETLAQGSKEVIQTLILTVALELVVDVQAAFIEISVREAAGVVHFRGEEREGGFQGREFIPQGKIALEC